MKDKKLKKNVLMILFSMLFSHLSYAVENTEVIGIQIEHKISPNVTLIDLGVVGKQRDYSLYFPSAKGSGFYFNMYDAKNELSPERTINDFIPPIGLATSTIWKLTTSFNVKDGAPKRFEVIDRSDSNNKIFNETMPVIQVAINSSEKTPRLTITNVSFDKIVTIKKITKVINGDFSEITIAANSSSSIDLNLPDCNLAKGGHKEDSVVFKITYVVDGNEKTANASIKYLCDKVKCSSEQKDNVIITPAEKEVEINKKRENLLKELRDNVVLTLDEKNAVIANRKKELMENEVKVVSLTVGEINEVKKNKREDLIQEIKNSVSLSEEEIAAVKGQQREYLIQNLNVKKKVILEQDAVGEPEQKGQLNEINECINDKLGVKSHKEKNNETGDTVMSILDQCRTKVVAAANKAVKALETKLECFLNWIDKRSQKNEGSTDVDASDVQSEIDECVKK
jgi:hypothetical protein